MVTLRNGLRVLFSIGALWLVAGCSTAKPAADSVLTIDAQEYQRVYDAAVLTLRDQGFLLDRQDYRFGRITTRPINSATIFEPWRNHGATMRQTQENTLNQQRRTITVFIDPMTTSAVVATQPSTQPAEQYLLRVEAIIERREVPDRRVTSSSNPEKIFSTLTAMPVELQERGISKPYWQALGRDEILERSLLAAIVRRSATVGN